MKVKTENSLKHKLHERIDHIAGNVILREDIQDLSDKRQMSRALSELIKSGHLAKIAFGIYAKAEKSLYTDKVILVVPFSIVVKEALNRKGIKWEPTLAQKAYNTQSTTQVPVRPGVRLRDRMRRKFAFGRQVFYFEDEIYAK